MKTRLANLKFRYKILLLPAIAALSFAFILVATVTLGKQNGRLWSDIEGGYYPAIEISRDLEDTLSKIQRGFQDSVAASDREGLTACDELRADFLRRAEALEKLPHA